MKSPINFCLASNSHEWLKTLRFFLTCFILCSFSKCLVKGSMTISACTHDEHLDIHCEFDESAKWIYLEVDKVLFKGLNVMSMSLECNTEHTFAKHCSVEMNQSIRIGDKLVLIRINNISKNLHNITVQCVIRTNNSNHNRHSLTRTIVVHSCQDRNQSTSAPPVTTTASGQPNASSSGASKAITTTASGQPNGSSPVASKASCGKFSTGDMIGVFFGGVLFLAVILGVAVLIDIRCLNKKFLQLLYNAVHRHSEV